MTSSLRAARLDLAPVRTADVDAVCALLWQPEVRRYLCDDTLVPRELVAAWIDESLDPADLTQYWLISTVADGMIGIVGVRPLMREALRLRNIGWRSLELLIALDPRHWGQGLAAEAVEAVVEHAAAHGVTFALVASIDEPNVRSHRLMRRCGFLELGRVPGPVYPNTVYERAV